ncbi:MAG: DUF6272 family protein, partial [Flavobacteriales bacterium]
GHGSAVLIFEHFGAMERDELERVVETVEAYARMANDPVPLRKRLVNVLVEALENVHCHTPPALIESGFARLIRENAGYRLLVGNALPSASAVLMAHRVEILNDMDEADLREHHLKLLANEGRTDRGGAGMGLLTMARRTNHAIQTHTVPRDSTTCFLLLELKLS